MPILSSSARRTTSLGAVLKKASASHLPCQGRAFRPWPPLPGTAWHYYRFCRCRRPSIGPRASAWAATRPCRNGGWRGVCGRGRSLLPGPATGVRRRTHGQDARHALELPRPRAHWASFRKQSRNHSSHTWISLSLRQCSKEKQWQKRFWCSSLG